MLLKVFFLLSFTRVYTRCFDQVVSLSIKDRQRIVGDHKDVSKWLKKTKKIIKNKWTRD